MRTVFDVYKTALEMFDNARDNIIKVRGKKIIEIIDYNDYMDSYYAYPYDSRGGKYIQIGHLKIYKKWLVSEIITEFTGENPPLMEYWSKLKMDRFVEKLEDGVHTYTYGERWLTFKEIEGVVKRLLNDPYTRQAVIVTHAPWDPYYSSWYVPCTMYHQFLYRNGVLDVLLYMRSWDMNRGFKYDIYLALFLQNYICAILNKNKIDCSLGKLRIHAGSFHIYLDDMDKIDMDKMNTQIYDLKHPISAFVIEDPYTLREELRRVYFSVAMNQKLNIIDFKNTFAIDAYHILWGDYNKTVL